jgi:hypothetical protein
MALLDPEKQPEAGILNNPQAIMALSLIGGKHPGVANLANVMLQLQQQNALNQYRDALIQQKQNELNLYQQGAQQLAQLRGNKGTPLSETGYVLKPDSKIVTGSGYLGGQIPSDEYQLRVAETLTQMGKPEQAAQFLPKPSDAYTLSPGQVRFDSANKIVAKGEIDPQKLLSQANKLRDEYVKQSGDFMKINDSYGRILASTTDPSPAGDIALIFNYMKMLDPGSVVRESEFATAQNAAGVPEQVRARYNRLLSGERLSPDMRQDFVTRSANLYNSQLKTQKQIESEYRRLAERTGVSAEDVIVNYQVPERDEAAQQVSQKIRRYNPATGKIE